MAETDNGVPPEQIVEGQETGYIHEPILDTEEMRKMFVGGISPESKDEELKAFFESMCDGKVSDHVIIRKDTEKKSHFGFITFETSQMVDEVLLKREELKFDNRVLDVNRAVPRNNTSPGAHEKTKKLFIANLPKFNCTEEELKKYFDARHDPKYGTIESIQLIKKKDEQGNKLEENKGYGFIMVSSTDMADKMAIQHATFDYGGRRIELKKSVPTTEGGGSRGGRGGGRGAGGQRGGGQQGGYGGYGGYGGAPAYGYGDWDGYGYNYDYYGGYGGGYGQPQGQGRGGRGGAYGRGRYAPY
ncbi:heterogeneous nuclear ribonucleoprotein A0-like [Hydractinia symbiolongicarpus]|uniref:heterogeneous nuclear ribonucleoprotein A0-like n=1 Tax=Hydractinia symbiolongicarpus TaxID=13093 RepID=UPI00254C60C1|nr:heterogeneous nuclear ribonucleoprotein A0-like [Hydractinia symbiolongicarpus]XP_057302575.1 heterogeneous nuclear ribonucleoprotein A0-like [Hydractinia symbiolongicarpus]